MSHSFTSGGAGKRGRGESRGAAQSPRCPWAGQEGSSPTPHHPAQDPVAWPSPASPTQERLLGPSWKPGSHWHRKEPGKFTQRCWQ